MTGGRKARIYTNFGILGTGKTWFTKNFLKKKDRELIIPANEYDPAWSGYKKFDLYALLSKVTEGEYDSFEEFYAAKGDEGKRLQRKFGIVLQKWLRTFRGTYVMALPEETDASKLKVLKLILNLKHGYLNGTLVVDDASNHLNFQNMHRFVKAYFKSCRHFKVDAFLNCHGPKEASADIIQFQPNIGVFETEGNWDHFREKFSAIRYEQLIETVTRVNCVANQQFYDLQLKAWRKEQRDEQEINDFCKVVDALISKQGNLRKYYFEIIPN